LSDKNKGDEEIALTGTTLRVYRYMYREGRPVGIHEIQHALNLSSSSVATYHVKKLENAGLVDKDPNSQYFVNRVVFENMVRVRRSLIPLQTAYAAAFATAILLLLTLFRPSVINATYVFSLIMMLFGCIIFVYQALVTARRASI
jgi:DNA-binding transcriptional ArsR family regulator